MNKFKVIRTLNVEKYGEFQVENSLIILEGLLNNGYKIIHITTMNNFIEYILKKVNNN